MTDEIKSLASNPNAFTLGRLSYLLRTAGASRDDLRRVMPAEQAAAVDAALDICTECILPTADATVAPTDVERCRKEDFNLFCLWGRKGAGKTSVVSSLLSTQTELSLCTGSQSERHKRMARLFAPIAGTDGFSLVPRDESLSNIQTTHCVVSHREGLATVRYPISFFEIDRKDDGSYPIYNRLITQEAVHIFCLDCTDDIQAQAREFLDLLDYLKGKSYLEYGSGLYIMVTKTDTMLRVPREYRAKAAQTLVTAGQRELWLKVINICYELGINDPTPIAYTVGDMALCRVFKPDPAPARRLWRLPILLKSRPLPSLVHRVLGFGNGWATAVVSSVVLGLIGYSLYVALRPDQPYPDAAIRPVDYQTAVLKSISDDVSGHSFHSASKAYDRLASGLDAAHRCRLRVDTALTEHEVALCEAHGFPNVAQQRGDRLLNDSCYRYDVLELAAAFSPILQAQVNEEMNRTDWNERISGYEKYSSMFSKEQKIYVETYKRDIAPAITRSRSCTTQDDVDYVNRVYSRYSGTWPYSNLEGMQKMVGQAEESFAQYEREHSFMGGIIGEASEYFDQFFQ